MNKPDPATQRLPDTDLSNWRLSPHSQWAFQHVRQLIPTASINACRGFSPLTQATSDVPDSLLLSLPGNEQSGIGLAAFLSQCQTDSMVILHRGKKVWQWSSPHNDMRKPHIVFSISKSITALLTGVLVGQGIIDVSRPVSYYLPGTLASAYSDCTVQHLLDMTVALAFKEDYLNPDGDYYRYRNATCWNPIDQNQPGPTLEKFLYGLTKAEFEHGEKFNYKSPNSDLLGLLLERTAGVPYAELLSDLLWKPLGAETNGYVTVDRAMTARAAGGVCVTADDLARLGQLVLDDGAVNGKSLVPESWIHDTVTGGDSAVWKNGDHVTLLPNGRYRNKWYQIGNTDRCFSGIGIHGQWLYINPTSSVVIVRLSSQSEPLDDNLDHELLAVFEQLSQAFNA